jgi:hypothetical protein
MLDDVVRRSDTNWHYEYLSPRHIVRSYSYLKVRSGCRRRVQLLLFFMALQPLWALAALQCPHLFRVGMTPWTSDEPVTRPLPKHRTAQTQNKHIHTPNIHALSGIRTHDRNVRAKTVHVLDRWATLNGVRSVSTPFRIWKDPVSTGVLIEAFRCLPQFLQACNGIMPQVSSWPVPSISFPSAGNYSSVILRVFVKKTLRF